MSTINLYHGCSLEAMKGMRNKQYDLAIVDPPYGIGGDRFFIINKPRKDPRNGRAIITKPKMVGSWDNDRPTAEYFQELCRVSKNQIIWGGNYFADLLQPSSAWVVWDKVNGGSDQADCELAWTSFNSAVRQVRFMWCIAQGKSISEGHIAQGNNKLWEKKIHPTQKPVAVYKWLLQNYGRCQTCGGAGVYKAGITELMLECKKCGGQRPKILDTHGGSMSIAIACHDMGFDLDLWEIDEDYYKAGVKRFNEHKSKQSLFPAGEGYEKSVFNGKEMPFPETEDNQLI